MDKKVAAIAALSAEHLSCLVKLTEAWLIRRDGLESNEKLLIVMTADLQHMKALHQVTQALIEANLRVPFSQLLRRLAEAEDLEEKNMKGGEKIPNGPTR